MRFTSVKVCLRSDTNTSQQHVRIITVCVICVLLSSSSVRCLLKQLLSSHVKVWDDVSLLGLILTQLAGVFPERVGSWSNRLSRFLGVFFTPGGVQWDEMSINSSTRLAKKKKEFTNSFSHQDSLCLPNRADLGFNLRCSNLLKTRQLGYYTLYKCLLDLYLRFLAN